MAERLSSHKRLLRTQGRFGFGEKEWRTERRLKPAIDAFAQFPNGFTAKDEETLASIEHAFVRSFSTVLTSMKPFLPPAVRFGEIGSHAKYYVAETQEVLDVDSRDFGVMDRRSGARNFFPKLLGTHDVEAIKATDGTKIEPIDQFAISEIYNNTPYRLDRRIRLIQDVLTHVLAGDAYTNPDYSSTIADFNGNVQAYKTAVERIAADNAKIVQESTGDLFNKLTQIEDIPQKNIPKSVEFLLLGTTSFSLDLRTFHLTRYKRKHVGRDQNGLPGKDEATQEREATSVEWCILAPYIKDKVLHKLLVNYLIPDNVLARFDTNLNNVSQIYYLLLPNLWDK